MPWKSSVRDRVKGIERGDNSVACPYCTGKKAIPGKTSFMVTQSELMNEWHIINWLFIHPDHISEDCNEKVWWICSTCGNTYFMSPNKRMHYIKRHQISCSYCKGLRRRKVHFI
jgi:DNA-directed RNA polymerase subunit RPC12/RpoP